RSVRGYYSLVLSADSCRTAGSCGLSARDEGGAFYLAPTRASPKNAVSPAVTARGCHWRAPSYCLPVRLKDLELENSRKAVNATLYSSILPSFYSQLRHHSRDARA